MTPTQLKAFAEVARQGSVRDAAQTLGVSDAAVSMHVASLRKKLGDDLFRRTSSGLAFTPGGLRLASRAVEMLGLQERTRHEVSAAAAGHRSIRVVSTSLFAESCAPGLIALFSSRAKDLEVELVVEPRERFTSLLASHAADVAIGPGMGGPRSGTAGKEFLRFELVAVAAPTHPLTTRPATARELARARWLMGPSAAENGLTHAWLERLGIPEHNQSIFQSQAAAVDEARRGHGLALALTTAISSDLTAGQLARVKGRGVSISGSWGAVSLPEDRRSDTASELMRFISTPRALKAMLGGAGTDVGRFRPSVHITLWH